MSESKLREAEILEIIKQIVSKEVKDMKRQREILTPIQVGSLEKLSRIMLNVLAANKEMQSSFGEMSDEELEKLADE